MRGLGCHCGYSMSYPREQDIQVWLLPWGLLPNAVYLLVRKCPADHSQTMATYMELAGMGCYIGKSPLIEGLAEAL